MTHAHIVEVEPRTAAIVRRTISFSDIPAAQRAARSTLEAALAAGNAQDAGPWLTVWRPPVDSAIDYAPGIFVAEGFAASGGTTLFTLPKGRTAHLRFEGGYDALPAAWGRLFEACKREGWSPAGLNWEIYTETVPRPVTDLMRGSISRRSDRYI